MVLCSVNGHEGDGPLMPMQPINEGERVLSLQMALKCADLVSRTRVRRWCFHCLVEVHRPSIHTCMHRCCYSCMTWQGHLAESLPVHLKWVQDLEQEFFLQGDQERARSMPISPLCDRTKEGITKSQVGFFEFVAMPLFSHFTARFKQAKPLLRGLLDNYAHWKGVAAAPGSTLQ